MFRSNPVLAYRLPNNIGGPWFSWFFNPRINIGGMINTGGEDELRLHRLHLAHPDLKGFFFEGELAPRSTPRRCRDEPGRVNTGCRWDFRELGGFGYQFNEHWDSSPISSISAMRASAPISTRA